MKFPVYPRHTPEKPIHFTVTGLQECTPFSTESLRSFLNGGIQRSLGGAGTVATERGALITLTYNHILCFCQYKKC